MAEVALENAMRYSGVFPGEQDEDSREFPTLFAISAQLIIADAELDNDESSVWIQPVYEDGSAACVQPARYTIDDAIVQHPHYAQEIGAWWQMRISLEENPCTDIALPQLNEQIWLGMGEMHPDIIAGLKMSGAESQALPANAAYASIVDGSVENTFVFGFSEVSGEVDDVTEPIGISEPVPDGVWELESVYLFDYQ